MTLGIYPSISLAQARLKAQQIIEAAKAGRDPSAESLHYLSLNTFEELAEQFISHYAKQHCSSNTLREYQRLIRKELLPCWQNVRLQQIGRSEVRALLDAIEIKRGRKVLAARVSSLISRLFNYALSRGICSDNPASRLSKTPMRPPAQRSFTTAELKAFWKALAAEQPAIEGVLGLILLTGQSPSSVMAMKWADISLDIWTVKQPRALKLPLQIYLAPAAQQLLKTALLHQPKGTYVFPSQKGGHLQYIRKAAARVSSRMGFAASWSPTDLRRICETGLRLQGARPEVIERIMGRTTALRQMKLPLAQWPGFEEIKPALAQWARQAGPKFGQVGPSHPSGKVISLFRQ